MTVIRTNGLSPAAQHRNEYAVVLPVMTLVAVGLLMAFSTSFAAGLAGRGLDALRPLGKHLVGLCLGAALLALAALRPLPWLRRYAHSIFALCFLALAAVFIPGVGHRVGYHARWISILGQQFQPSEFAKVGLVLFLAATLSNRVQARQRGRPTSVWGPVLVACIAPLLVLLEPNFATAAVMGLAILVMLYLAGEPLRLIGVLILGAAVLFLLGLQLDPGDKWQRLAAFTGSGGLAAHAQGVGYQSIQSVRALGAGGVVGWGLGASSAKFGALPYSHTDFVFAVLGQETGFLGCLLVLACYVALGINCLAIAQRLRGTFPSLLIAGLALTLTLQALVNIAIAVALWVPMGVPLPFVSYGSSSLAASLAAVGLMINCARNGASFPHNR